MKFNLQILFDAKGVKLPEPTDLGVCDVVTSGDAMQAWTRIGIQATPVIYPDHRPLFDSRIIVVTGRQPDNTGKGQRWTRQQWDLREVGK